MATTIGRINFDQVVAAARRAVVRGFGIIWGHGGQPSLGSIHHVRSGEGGDQR